MDLKYIHIFETCISVIYQKVLLKQECVSPAFVVRENTYPWIPYPQYPTPQIPYPQIHCPPDTLISQISYPTDTLPPWILYPLHTNPSDTLPVDTLPPDTLPMGYPTPQDTLPLWIPYLQVPYPQDTLPPDTLPPGYPTPPERTWDQRYPAPCEHYIPAATAGGNEIPQSSL